MTLLHAAECDPPHAFPFHFSNSQNFGYKKFSNTKAASARHSVRTSVRASRRDAPESLKETSALMGVVTPRGPRKAPRGRAGCRAPDAPAASRAKKAARPRTSILSGGTGKPGNPARNGVTLYAVLSSGRCSIAPVFPQKMVCQARLGRRTSEGIDPSVRGGTTRFKSPQRASFVVRNRRKLTAAPRGANRPANSDHARYRRVHRISSRVRDDRDTPLVWDETERHIQCFEQKVNKNLFRSGAGQPRNTSAGFRASP